jgi:hypothetical protein
MNVENRIGSGSAVFIGLAIVSGAYVLLFPFSTLWGFLVPVAVFFAPALDIHGYSPMGLLVEISLICVLAFFGIAAKRKWLAVYAAGIILYALDGLLAARAAGGLVGFNMAIGFGFMLLLMFVIHIAGIVVMVSGATAMLTARDNEALARQLEIQAELARKLAQEVDDPPPPAAKFGSRYRLDPP